MIWIMVLAYALDAFTIVHIFYMSLGLLIQVVTLLPEVQKFFMLDGRYERS